MIDKTVASPEVALADVPDGATVMIGGFGNAGMPAALIDALIAQGLGVVAVTGPGKATSGPALRIPLRRGAPTQRVATDLEQVLGSLTPYVMYTPGGRVWTIDPRPEVGGAPFFLSLRGEQIVGAWELDQLPTGAGR